VASALARIDIEARPLSDYKSHANLNARAELLAYPIADAIKLVLVQGSAEINALYCAARPGVLGLLALDGLCRVEVLRLNVSVPRRQDERADPSAH
jgi:hypothetical protein